MALYDSSVQALQRLLTSGTCSITKIPQGIPQMINGIEYCAIEITCDDGTQYGIQAHGEEAIELHKEALRQYVIEKEERKDLPLV
jgi:hypothetical protein